MEDKGIKSLLTIQKNKWLDYVLRYGLSILAVIVAFWLYWVLTGFFGSRLPTFILFYPVVIIVALLAGFKPGILATFLSATLAVIGIIPPLGKFIFESSIDQITVMIFIIFGVMISSVTGFYRQKREKAEEELKIERDNLNSILNTTKSGIYIVNSDYELEYVNPTIKKDFGLLKRQKCHKYFYDIDNICPNCKIEKAFEGDLVEWEQHSSKSNKTYDALAKPITKVDGSIAVVVFLYDVTWRDKAEEQLKEVISELERSNQELQSFAYITSHDLQEPLRTMGSYAGLLKMRYEGQFDPDADDFLNYMVSGAQRMQDMIRGLLDYSRVGTHGEYFTKFNAEDALKTAISNLQSSIQECHAEVTHDKMPNITADKDQITRIFQNLIGNALKFRRKGIHPKIHISCRKGDTECIFSVKDNGIGIKEQYTDRIFEVFKRLHAIDEYQGAGIGLAITKRIIERHGGHVWVESEYGVGSTFYFTIPIKNE